MNFGLREQRRFARMRPEDRAFLIKGKAVVLTCLASLLLLLGGSIKAPKTCTGGMFLGPIIAIALFLMLIFVVGSCGLKRNSDGLYGCYLLGVFFAILLLLVFIIFGYIAVGGIDWGHAANHVCNSMTDLVRDPGTGIFVPRPSSFDRWAKRHGVDADVRVMSPIESGCCKPPSWCGLTYVNGTTWISTPASAPATNINRDDVDCSRWSNDHQTLCFQCDSCKAGFLHNTSEAWSAAAIYIIIAFIGLILSSLALCADQVTGNNRRSPA